MLDELLKYKKVKHYHQLRYLAQKHEGSVLKIRFVLLPFSYVFLLTGRQQHHVIWETLDTKEATYIWHVEKNKTTLRNALKLIDEKLGVIRTKIRADYLPRLPFWIGAKIITLWHTKCGNFNHLCYIKR